MPTNIQHNDYLRGSEWRKWDLHIHTPGTAKNDQFGTSAWDEFFLRLEQSDICAFGITDYWSMDNYYEVKAAQNSGRLNGKFVFPNVELRITPVTDSNTPINLHVLFDPDLDKEVIERDFFQKCEFLYEGTKYTATRTQLISLGRTLRKNQNLEEVAAWKAGIEQFVVSYDRIFTCLKTPSLHGRYLIGVSNSSSDGNSGIQESALSATRKEIYRQSNIVFSSSQKDASYFLGNGALSVKQIVDEYGSLKPCICGSDAHRLEDIACRFTWIKADPTFQGLRQIVFEPESRVRISETRPDEKPSYCLIDSIELSSPSGVWKQQIPVNQNLTAIIGGRSSGKSTLLDVIASKCNGKKEQQESLLRSFTKTLEPNVSIHWKNEQLQTNNDGRNLVEYFPQNYIVEIAESPDRLNDILVRILEDLGKQELLERVKSIKQNHTQKTIVTCNQLDSLYRQRMQLADKQDVVANATAVEKEIETLIRQATEVAGKLKVSPEQLELSQQANNTVVAKQNELDRTNQYVHVLKELQDQSIILVNEPIQINQLPPEIQAELRRTVNAAKAHVEKTWIDKSRELSDIMEQRAKTLSSEIQQLQESVEYKQWVQFENSNAQYADINAKIKEEKRKLELANQMTKEIQIHDQAIDDLISKLSESPREYGAELDRLGKLLSIDKDGLSISAKRILREKEIVEFLEPRLTKRSDEQKTLVEDYSKRFHLRTPEEIKQFIKDLFGSKIQLNQGNTPLSVLQELLSQNWEDLQFDVTYQGDSFLKMSPGKKAFVILKLMLDFSKQQQPVLIDQPEDNLDNRTIYTDLVAYLRKKKTTRQIIVVSHNANIVVGADAEEVIVANQNGSDAKNPDGVKFYYVSGALENTRAKDSTESCVLLAQGIREHVCEILEGGQSAFVMREKKYSLKEN